jgi:coenzyme PQQ precursor peptide PqqA
VSGHQVRVSSIARKGAVALFSTHGRLVAVRICREETTMAWTTPTLVEICIGLEINGYLPAEF